MPDARVTVAALSLVLFAFGFGGLAPGVCRAAHVNIPEQAAAEHEQRVWQKQDGLPDNQVQSLLQTRDGYLWIGTKKGLARFDGVKFTVFNRANTPSLESDDVRFLAEDSQSNLWIATRPGLLRFGNREIRRFGEPDGLCGGVHYAPYASKLGDLWIASYGWLTRFREGEMNCYGRAEGLMREIISMQEDDQGMLWVGQGKALQWFDPQTATFSTNCMPQHLLHTSAETLQRDAKGNMWAVFSEVELLPGKDAPDFKQWVYRFADGKWQSVPGNPHGNDGRPFFILPDLDGNVWMPGGLGQILRIREGKIERFALAGEGQKNWAQCAFADREGNLWFGTEAGGLQRWTPRKFTTYTTREGLADDNSWTIFEARDGSVWIGTDGGLSHLKNGKFFNFGEQQGLLRKEVRSVVEDRSGRIWVGTMKGLFSYRAGEFSPLQFPGAWFETKIRVLLTASDGALWVGTVTGLTHLRSDARTQYTRTNGLAHHEVLALLENRVGDLWIGTAGGVQRLRGAQFTTFTRTNGLSSDTAWALHEDAEGVIWIGTENGLNRLQDTHITAFTTREGLLDKLVNYILEDDFGRLWISHDRGIYWVRKEDFAEVASGRRKSLRCVSFDESDGLISIETNGQKSNPAGCKTSDGRLWFPTTKGVAVIDPRLANFDEMAPVTAIEQVRANGTVALDNGPNGTRLDGTGRTALPPATLPRQFAPGSARVLEFRYTANTFVAPEKARFKYRMLGLNENWIEAGARREAYFTDLRPGDYQFEVIAANHHGVWQERGAMFAFHLAPFIYQTWWFYLVCGLAAAGVVAGLTVWRIHELRKLHRLEQSAAISDERTRIAKDLHDGVGADLTRLTMLADLAGGEAGAGGAEYLQKLSQSSRDAARELKELIWIANPANDALDGLISRICQNAEDFLRDARIRCRFELAPHLPPWSLSMEQRRNLLLVAREALNNVAKHAGATEVCIRAHANDDRLQLVIEDDGRGFEFRAVRPGSLGLESMRQRVEKMHGDFHLESRPGAGTRILINLKLKHLGHAGPQ